MARPEWVALGRIARAHGIRGEVRVLLDNPASRTLEAVRSVVLRGREGSRTVAVERARSVPGGGCLLKLEGVPDRTAAEALSGCVVEVPRDALAPEEESEYYVCDLVGASVVGPDGPLGTIEAVQSYPSADALVVRCVSCARGTVEVPLVEDFIERVRVQDRTVVVRAAALAFFLP
jgi:16S rRNA processing protein RimM